MSRFHCASLLAVATALACAPPTDAEESGRAVRRAQAEVGLTTRLDGGDPYKC